MSIVCRFLLSILGLVLFIVRSELICHRYSGIGVLFHRWQILALSLRQLRFKLLYLIPTGYNLSRSMPMLSPSP